jgi:hypothetical protein
MKKNKQKACSGHYTRLKSFSKNPSASQVCFFETAITVIVLVAVAIGHL